MYFVLNRVSIKKTQTSVSDLVSQSFHTYTDTVEVLFLKTTHRKLDYASS